jgi:phosphatidylinositol alpha-1,6-mannosyltransferase
LLDAWPTVKAQVPDAQLWIVGSGDDESRLKERANALPQSVLGSVHFLGVVGHARLLELYQEARVFCMPSRGEGFGLVFAEAMRYGLPCICSFDSSAEIVLDGDTGLVVPQEPGAIAAACVRVLSDLELANSMSRSGHDRYRAEFTFPAMRRRVLTAYRLTLADS